MPVAIQMAAYGPPAVLVPVDVPEPVPGPGDVIVRALVIGVNRADCFIRSGAWPQAGPWPYVPGLECCGVVHRCGAQVTAFAPGDAVITMMQRLGGIHGERPGGYQDLVRVSENVLVRVPDEIDWDTLGTLGLPAVTAVGSVEALAVEPGMRVLVHAGSSAVGQLAIQVLRARRAEVVATGTRPAKSAAILDAGATAFACTAEPTWPRDVGPVDRVIDLVGGPLFGATVGLLRPGGRLVFVGGTAGGDLAFSGWDLMRPATLTGWSSESLTARTLARHVAQVAALSASGQLRCRHVARFPLADAAEAHGELESGALTGRVVLIPAHPR